MAITLADFTKIWASTSPLTPYSFSESNYKEGWNFIGGTPPARQMWDSIQNQNDEKLKYIVDNFLPLSGGTVTGNLEVNGTLTQNGYNVLTDATVGTVVSNSNNAINIPNSTGKTLISVVLSAGVWIVVGKSQINVNHNGNYGIILSDVGDAFAFDFDGVYADTCTNGGIFAGTVTKIFKLTTQKTIYLNAYTGGGATTSLRNFISAVRIA